jgi:L-threonylcarbamoyladenylate synthase
MSAASKSQVARIYRPTPLNLSRLAARLRSGHLVGVPSETVYGLAADALNPDACAKIFAAKGRPTTDPLIVHLASVIDLASVAQANPAALELAKAFWPGPLTLVLPKLPVVPRLITAGRDTVAVRVPDHPVFRNLIRLTGRPLAAPSANPFGYISPTCAAHVRDGLRGSGLTAVLDGGACDIGVESTIIDLSMPGRPRLLRPGGLDIAAIQATLGQKLERPRSRTVAANKAATAPGMLSRHYSPTTPLTLHTKLDAEDARNTSAGEVLLLLRRPEAHQLRPLSSAAIARLHWLSETGELAEIARNLFAALRRLDASKSSRIHAALVPGNEGLAPAINDRLRRAAAKR